MRRTWLWRILVLTRPAWHDECINWCVSVGLTKFYCNIITVIIFDWEFDRSVDGIQGNEIQASSITMSSYRENIIFETKDWNRKLNPDHWRSEARIRFTHAGRAGHRSQFLLELKENTALQMHTGRHVQKWILSFSESSTYIIFPIECNVLGRKLIFWASMMVRFAENRLKAITQRNLKVALYIINFWRELILVDLVTPSSGETSQQLCI